MRIFFVIIFFILITSTGFVYRFCSSEKISEKLEEGFLSPPAESKPMVWWHWMDGNITKEGIKADLTWMKRVGIGGFHQFEISMKTPIVVKNPLEYMSDGWKDVFRYALKTADSLNLEMGIASSCGWSESGGPWVKPEAAMKKYVWSEINIEGGKPFCGKLPQPPATTGVFQDIPNGPSRYGTIPYWFSYKDEYYKDAAVVAFRVPKHDLLTDDLHPKITSSGGKFDIQQLTDNNLSETILLPAEKDGKDSWIQFEFDNPAMVQSVSLVAKDQVIRSSRRIEVSQDGYSFKSVSDFLSDNSPQTTITFSPVQGRFYRIVFHTLKKEEGDKEAGVRIAEVKLYVAAHVNRFEDKAGFVALNGYKKGLYTFETPFVSGTDDVVQKEDIVDLTSKMDSDGKLNWTPPEGNWRVLRIGYSLTGKTNHPAPLEATGLEVDKLSKKYVRDFYTRYLGMYQDVTSVLTEGCLKSMVTDSWEAGTLNWTDNMQEEFKKHCGYDITPWLPVLAGHIVGDSRSSDRFLWDFRKTIGELTVENFYDQLTEMLHERGIKRYSESHENGRHFIADGMEVKRTADVPMGATWTPDEIGSDIYENNHIADVRESASVAHLYGQNLVAAESFSTMNPPYGWSPETLKHTADMELSCGLNRFVIHCSVHQPVFDKVPGVCLDPFGQWFTRNETWAEEAGPWIMYLTRSSYMLQQGKFLADILLYYGEDNNLTSLYKQNLPEIPYGYNYDFINSDALIHLLSANHHGEIVTASGMSYKMLILDDNAEYMSLPVLRKISELVNEGAVIVGKKPVGTPSLSDDTLEYRAIVNNLWKNEHGENSIGKGKVFSGMTIGEVMKELKVQPDFKCISPSEDKKLFFVHRKMEHVDIYWVNNRNFHKENMDVAFRVEGKIPEIWHPDNGKMEMCSYKMQGAYTEVSLNLESDDAVFVVFRKETRKKSVTVVPPSEYQLAEIKGPWDVRFQPQRGAPDGQVVFEELSSWNENKNPAIKYFSGTAEYSKKIQLPEDKIKRNTRLWLDLGEVRNLAEVIVNGKSMGILWKSPFRIDITEAVKPGENELKIKVTNLWVNRIIGDYQPGTKEKISFTTTPFYNIHSQLIPSGLLGPVKLTNIGVN
jgi:hypothetical protein